MKKILSKLSALLLLSAAFIAFASELSAIDVGGLFNSSDVKTSGTFISGPAFSDKESDYVVVIFCDPSETRSGTYFNVVNSLQYKISEYPKKVTTLAIARGTRRIVLDQLNGIKPLFSFYADEKDELFRQYAASEIFLPFAIIVEDGKVKWKGSPTDVEGVLDRIMAGKFDYSKQLQIDLLRNELRSAVQSSLPTVILRTADKILAIQPDDMIAIQAKLVVFNTRGDDKKGVVFLRETVKKCPDNLNVRMLYLDSLVRTFDRKIFVDEFPRMANDFRKSPESLLRIAYYVVSSAPFGWADPDVLAKIADDVMSFEKTLAPERMALACELAGRAAYLKCNIADAVKYQKKAYSLMRDSVGEEYQKVLLDYYLSIEKSSANKAKDK